MVKVVSGGLLSNCENRRLVPALRVPEEEEKSKSGMETLSQFSGAS